MQRFWKRGVNSAEASDRNGIKRATGAGPQSQLNVDHVPLSKTPDGFPSCMPTRRQRMELLSLVIHHADSVQKLYLVPKRDVKTEDNSGRIFWTESSGTADAVNDKTYQRWHEVLQDGLVPMSVHALCLLQGSQHLDPGSTDDEEETYFASLGGMDTEIQVMAILARAAALHESTCTAGADGLDKLTNLSTDDGNDGKDGMEPINVAMKLTAMLLFHIVLSASSPSQDMDGSLTEATKNVVGYDGRIRHVIKLACVDAMSRAIVDSVDAYEKGTRNQSGDGNEPSSGLCDTDSNSWNILNIRSFLEQEDLARDAIFGTPSSKLKENQKETEDGQEKLSEGYQDDATVESSEAKDHAEVNFDATADETNLVGQPSSRGPCHLEDRPQEATLRDVDGDILYIGGIMSKDDSSGEIAQSSPVKSFASPVESYEADANETQGSNGGKDDTSQENGSETNRASVISTNVSGPSSPEIGEDHASNEDAARARRLFNAKFLATRKFELIERLVAIELVRFLMAEEREKKQRERELDERRNVGNKISALFNQSTNLDNPKDDAMEDGSESSDASDKSDEVNSSHYFTASRIKKIKRGAKIAGAGLAIGTVFAITGGLAAPALAAGIGGIAALTGATTASSTALLAVLATFKAGALLFGAGGGGLAAYKMKKRTAGLQQFEIRRENIDQYIYEGADEDSIKRGVESMLPQLHTTVAVSGWLRDNDISDYQLAWGIQPTCTYEKRDNFKQRVLQMKRFYSIYNPPLVYLCEDFMLTLQQRLKKDFSWDRIWSQLEQKYGKSPDHMMPLDTPHDNEVLLSYEEKEMIENVLTNSKMANFSHRGHRVDEKSFDFHEHDEIADFLSKVTPKKSRKGGGDSPRYERQRSADTEALELEIGTVSSPGDSLSASAAVDALPGYAPMPEEEVSPPHSLHRASASSPSKSNECISPSLQERMSQQRDQQLSFLRDKGIIDDESKLNEGAGSPRMKGDDGTVKRYIGNDPPPSKVVDQADEWLEDDERCPIVWDWRRVYGIADIHTISWESQHLSSLCHIVENLAIEVSSQATRVALQFSVIGAIISAVAIPSALMTASKLIDDPYQICILRADEAGRELAKCLLQSDEKRPVSLVGFSFGARVIYACLRELARQQEIWEDSRAPKTCGSPDQKDGSRLPSFLKKKSKENLRFEYDREPASLVEDVVFIGLPRVYDKTVISSCRRVTGGRLVNCYISHDWLLSLMFAARGGFPCGIRPIKDVPGVENIDVSDLVESHIRYADAVPRILQRVRFFEP